MLRNPMIMMMVATGVLVVAMPYILVSAVVRNMIVRMLRCMVFYLQKNMDPELAKEVTERQNRLANIQNSMTSGDLRGGYVVLPDVDN
jgi:hypothetical protein